MTRASRRSPVDSTSLASIGFSPEHNVLEIEFRNGLVYAYFGVPQALHDELLAAKSKGTFMNRFIRGHFPHQRVDRSRPGELTQ